MAFSDKDKHEGRGRKRISRFKNQFEGMGFKSSFHNLQHDFSGPVQAKLEISSPEDIHEQQADEIARKVVSGEDAGMEVSASANTVMTKWEGSDLHVDEEFEHKLSSSRGRGEQLDDSTRSEMEGHMASDLGEVRIHTDSEASELSESINAKAFTHGQDVYFKEGEFNPDSVEGKELLAHELVHTVQQGKGVERKVMRAMKFEFQTGNYVWAIKNTGNPDPVLLPRKYAPTSTSYTDDTPGASEERGDKSAYLSTGKHGRPAREAGYGFVEVERPLVMKKAKEVPFEMVKATTGIDASKPAQYEVHIKVFNLDKYLDKGVVPADADIVIFHTVNNASIPFPHNPYTYEFIYYDGDKYIEDDKPVVGPVFENPALNIHRDPDGKIVSGAEKYMVKKKKPGENKDWVDMDKPAQFIKEYKFTKPVADIKDILNTKVTEGQLELIKETDNAQLLDENMYNPNTFEFKYFNSDGTTQLQIHLSEDGEFKKKHVPLMRVGRGDGNAIDYKKESQKIEIWKVTIDKAGAIDYDGQKAKVDQVGKTVDYADNNKYPEMKGKYNPGTYEKKYYLSTDFDGENLKPGATRLDVHLTKDGSTLKKGHVQFMERKKLPQMEQTAIELQSEHGGFLEFETPKWFDDWEELKLRIQDAKDMTDAFNNATPVDTGVADAIRAIKSGGIKIVEWPAGYSTGHLTNLIKDDRRLVVQIMDDEWKARIQSSYEVSLSQYSQLLAAGSSADTIDYYTPTISGSKAVFDTGFDNVKLMYSDKPKFIDKGKKKTLDLTNTNKADLLNLQGLLQIITNYLIRGQYTDKSTSPAKDLAQVMSRTSFYSMYHSILSEKERLLFQYMVQNNIITQALEAPLNKFLQDNKKSNTPETVAPGFVEGNALVYRKKHQKGAGPKIKEWLKSIIHGYKRDDKPIDTDLLSPPETGSKAMGAHKAEENLARFEVRYSKNLLGGQDRRADEWVKYAEDLFKWAAKRGDTPDNPTTPGVNEAAKTGLKLPD
jgi:hypothetical protein